MEQITLDFTHCRDRAALYGEMREKMAWADWYGETLDALYDILTGQPGGRGAYLILRKRCMEEGAAADYLGRIEQVFRDAARDTDGLTVRVEYVP